MKFSKAGGYPIRSILPLTRNLPPTSRNPLFFANSLVLSLLFLARLQEAMCDDASSKALVVVIRPGRQAKRKAKGPHRARLRGIPPSSTGSPAVVGAKIPATNNHAAAPTTINPGLTSDGASDVHDAAKSLSAAGSDDAPALAHDNIPVPTMSLANACPTACSLSGSLSGHGFSSRSSNDSSSGLLSPSSPPWLPNAVAKSFDSVHFAVWCLMISLPQGTRLRRTVKRIKARLDQIQVWLNTLCYY